MRPTVQESLAGVVRILRGTVAPNVDDAHAQAQLRQAIRVLEQLPADPPAQVAAELDAMQEITAACRDWIAATDDRAGFTPLDTVEPAGDRTEDPAIASVPTTNLEKRVEDVRNSLEQFLVELRQWRATNGTASSEEIFARIGTGLAEPTRGGS